MGMAWAGAVVGTPLEESVQGSDLSRVGPSQPLLCFILHQLTFSGLV